MSRGLLSGMLDGVPRAGNIAKHEECHLMCAVYETEDGGVDEAVFAVGADWLMRWWHYHVMEGRGKATRLQLRRWLQEEYTNDDAIMVLEDAVREGRVLMWHIDETEWRKG